MLMLLKLYLFIKINNKWGIEQEKYIYMCKKKLIEASLLII